MRRLDIPAMYPEPPKAGCEVVLQFDLAGGNREPLNGPRMVLLRFILPPTADGLGSEVAVVASMPRFRDVSESHERVPPRGNGDEVVFNQRIAAGSEGTASL